MGRRRLMRWWSAGVDEALFNHDDHDLYLGHVMWSVFRSSSSALLPPSASAFILHPPPPDVRQPPSSLLRHLTAHCVSAISPRRLCDHPPNHMARCCAWDQPKFSFPLVEGPSSPNPGWAAASGRGSETRCDFPFGCGNCDCGAGTEAVPAAGCG